MVNSGFLDGLTGEGSHSKKKITWLEEKGIGHASQVNFKLRDWVFSRQRYWGEPIPIVYCDKCGCVPLPERELPLRLPGWRNYELTDDGESPPGDTDWVNTTCPLRRPPAKRETDTMPQWAGPPGISSVYADPHNDDAIASKEALGTGCPWTDWYNGGMEHTTLHLLYSRHKFLYDIGVVPHQGAVPEAYLPRHDPGPEPPHAFENQPDAERKRLLAEYGDEAQGLVEKYGEMAEHPRRQDVQVLGQRRQPRRCCQRVRRRHAAPLRDVHWRLRESCALEHFFHQGLQAVPR